MSALCKCGRKLNGRKEYSEHWTSHLEFGYQNGHTLPRLQMTNSRERKRLSPNIELPYLNYITK